MASQQWDSVNIYMRTASRVERHLRIIVHAVDSCFLQLYDLLPKQRLYKIKFRQHIEEIQQCFARLKTLNDYLNEIREEASEVIGLPLHERSPKLMHSRENFSEIARILILEMEQRAMDIYRATKAFKDRLNNRKNKI